MNTRNLGQKGEDIACKYLEKQGISVVDRNYLRKWGEIDIVGKKANELHFFEVKSMVTNVMDKKDAYRPEDNVHALKLKRLGRIVETYLLEKGGGLNTYFQFHVLCVYLNPVTRRARVIWLKNVIL